MKSTNSSRGKRRLTASELLALPSLNEKVRAQIERQLEVPAPRLLADVALEQETGGKGKARIRVSAAAQRTSDTGQVFASKWELCVYEWLRRTIPAQHLHLQPAFLLQPAVQDDKGCKVRAIRYMADFLISTTPRTDECAPLGATDIVIDAKGWRTEIFRMKAKLFVGVYGRAIRLVRQGHNEDMENILVEYKSKLNEHNRTA